MAASWAARGISRSMWLVAPSAAPKTKAATTGAAVLPRLTSPSARVPIATTTLVSLALGRGEGVGRAGGVYVDSLGVARTRPHFQPVESFRVSLHPEYGSA